VYIQCMIKLINSSLSVLAQNVLSGPVTTRLWSPGTNSGRRGPVGQCPFQALRQRHRDRDTETQRQRERHRDRGRERHRDRDRDRRAGFSTNHMPFYILFQAMVLFTGAKSFKQELLSPFSSLCKDPHIQVRKSVAVGFHEVSLKTKVKGHTRMI
jgi:hypothetical protein